MNLFSNQPSEPALLLDRSLWHFRWCYRVDLPGRKAIGVNATSNDPVAFADYVVPVPIDATVISPIVGPFPVVEWVPHRIVGRGYDVTNIAGPVKDLRLADLLLADVWFPLRTGVASDPVPTVGKCMSVYEDEGGEIRAAVSFITVIGSVATHFDLSPHTLTPVIK